MHAVHHAAGEVVLAPGFTGGESRMMARIKGTTIFQ